jgi:Uma2 family endonuclease
VARVAQRSGISAAEYLAWERDQPSRHEYFRGQVFAMAGGSPRHNALCSATNAALHGAYRDHGCIVFSSDQRVGVGGGERYVYADVTVVCGGVELEPGTTDVISNPTVLVEVLSSSTEQYDRGLKWEGYQRIGSVTDYVLVAQSEPRIEHFRRESGGTWVYRSAGPGDRVRLTSGAELCVDDIFHGVVELVGD